jgi:tricorn protease
VTVVARGDVFTVPAKDGPTRNLTQTQGVHERAATWSPDGKWIAYLSDATGRIRALHPPAGRPQPRHAADQGQRHLSFTPVWSPDSKKLIWGDRKQRLRFVEVETKAVTTIDENPDAPIASYDWAPDSQWVTWIHQERGTLTKVMLHGLADKKTLTVDDGWYAPSQPAFSDDGKWLLFASARDFRPSTPTPSGTTPTSTWSASTWSPCPRTPPRPSPRRATRSPSPRTKRSPTTRSPPPPKTTNLTDKVAKAGRQKAGDAGKSKTENQKSKIVVKVDADGLAGRLISLPITPSNYSAIQMVGDKVYYRRVPGGPIGGGGGGEGFGATRDNRNVVAVYDLKARKETELGNFDSFEITANGKKVLVRAGRDYSLIDLPSARVELKPDSKLDLSGLEVRLDRPAEWAQIFDESWRQMRDFFYAPNMHGVDWPAQRAKYGALLPAVTTRNDLTYLIGEMISELHIGHAYVGGGDRVEAPRIRTGLLGAELSRDPASRAYRIDRILHGENWQTKTRSPLTELGVNVSAGDYILAVNGTPTRDLANIYSALIGTVGRQVVLRVNAQPTDEGARDVTVVPIADEAPLYYEQFVQGNIDHVAAKTGGKVGYLHIPDMGPEGLNEFVRRYYPQLGKQALIIDVRGNGGGNVSPMIIERLRRELAMVNLRRNGTPSTNPAQLLNGPKVTLLNEYSASDGDLFPYRFREAGLGQLIGKRSWGGVVGISGTLPFTDGGTLNKPEFAPYAKDGKSWIIEGHGVDPDIVVDNDPAREFRGEDQQLDKAIEVILQELKTKGKTLPPPPAWPDKS